MTVNDQAPRKTYTYQPLDDIQHQIRLVELLPPDGELVWVKLHTCYLAKAPAFEALSFTWGPAEDKGSSFVVCGGCAIDVPPVLLAHLHALRQLPHVPLLWIDALSISQSSDHRVERRVALGNIPIIYRSAHRTLCFPGRHLSSLKAIIAATRSIGNYDKPISECLLATDIYHSTYKVTPDMLQAFGNAKGTINRAMVRDIGAFLGQQYFQRYI